MALVPVRSPTAPTWETQLPRRAFIDRDKTIIRLCTGARVLHLGAADSPFSEIAATQGTLLHQKVRAVARQVVGVDLDRSAVDYLNTVHGLTDILYGDATALPGDPRLHGDFDLILCCDVIEHVPNIGSLLDSCLDHMGEHTQLLLTTINATALKPALRALLHREAVHPDHIAYFSFATLCSLFRRYHLDPIYAGYFTYSTVTFAARLAFGISTFMSSPSADGILIIGRKASHP